VGRGICIKAQSISWPDGIKFDLDQALVLSGLVLLMLVVLLFRFFVLSLGSTYISFASSCQVIG